MNPRAERMEQRFEVVTLVAALLVVPTLVIESSDLGQPWDAIALVVMVVGIGFVAVLTAAAAERFIRSREAAEQREDILGRLDDIARRLDGLERR